MEYSHRVAVLPIDSKRCTKHYNLFLFLSMGIYVCVCMYAIRTIPHKKATPSTKFIQWTG